MDNSWLIWSALIAPIFSYHNTLTLRTTRSFQNQTEIMTLIAICAHIFNITLRSGLGQGGSLDWLGLYLLDLLVVLAGSVGGAYWYACWHHGVTGECWSNFESQLIYCTGKDSGES